MSLRDAVQAGLDALGELDVRDRACAELALQYASAIDGDGDWQDRQRDPLSELGSRLLAALTALGMTPAARKNVTEAKTGPVGSPLDELRAKRAARTATS